MKVKSDWVEIQGINRAKRFRLKLSNPRSQEVSLLLLKKAKVVTAPGHAFGEHGDNFIRMSLGTSTENLKMAAQRLCDAF